MLAGLVWTPAGRTGYSRQFDQMSLALLMVAPCQIKKAAGNTNSVSTVALTIPPTMGAAIRQIGRAHV